MNKYLRWYEIHKELILEITKQIVIMITMKIVWVTHEKVANELSGPFAKVGTPQADNDYSNPPANFHKCWLKYNIYLSQNILLIFLDYTNTHKVVKQIEKHNWVILT